MNISNKFDSVRLCSDHQVKDSLVSCQQRKAEVVLLKRLIVSWHSGQVGMLATGNVAASRIDTVKFMFRHKMVEIHAKESFRKREAAAIQVAILRSLVCLVIGRTGATAIHHAVGDNNIGKSTLFSKRLRMGNYAKEPWKRCKGATHNLVLMTLWIALGVFGQSGVLALRIAEVGKRRGHAKLRGHREMVATFVTSDHFSKFNHVTPKNARLAGMVSGTIGLNGVFALHLVEED